VSPKSWAVVVLAVIALCVVVGLALAANLDFVLIGLAIIVALVATYLVGRRDNPDGDG
jgi:1,4-dihydroxy-2-naphthoate octaprenyltransferase